MKRHSTILTSFVGLCLAGFAVMGCEKSSDEREIAEEQLEEQVEENPAVKPVQEIKDDPASFVGKTVTIAGEVEEIFSPGVMRVDGVTTLWGDEIFVLANDDALPNKAVTEDEKLKITGTVQTVTVAEIEADFEVDLETEVEAEIESYPVLVAERMDVADVI